MDSSYGVKPSDLKDVTGPTWRKSMWLVMSGSSGSRRANLGTESMAGITEADLGI
ncbi:hypothetical protein SERLA73DRAFT_187531 [Serpula lacrymans var. lacrymans S7.3]|uniref:Uncharacterized protein n=2 Tax=Serpula lacrymans var. lacrymans TaxID=341189 RepID=F8Q9E9_SERL3|nr:uncharacterized protein SERLADRAFT_477185 [Serpula lacrymans var. lacrymans S7.9]EGN95204.1 hypothetical protein SERLA73DRAFT_187531 [Serpula lacrymans var. lacrymans S7.3]EGO20732.1 hypothetical protein SERLADRAFT_477185 [Serpula lacrymans var. lacrymans S7.9]